MSTILKLSTGERNKVLCENESKTIQLHVAKTERLEKLFNGKLYVFVKAKVSKNKDVDILGAVKNQGW